MAKSSGRILFLGLIVSTLIGVAYFYQKNPRTAAKLENTDPAPNSDSTQAGNLVRMLREAQCAQQIESLLADWGAGERPEWDITMNGAGNALFLRAPTQTVGRWVHADFITDKVVQLTLASRSVRIEATFSKDDCTPEFHRRSRKTGHVTASEDFTDSDLAQIVETQKDGIVYIWSPHMPYSVQALSTVRQVAKNLNLQLVTIMDPFANKDFADRVARKNRIPASDMRPLNSMELVLRDMTLHFPAMVVFSRGKMVQGTYLGIHEADQYEKFIKERLAL